MRAPRVGSITCLDSTVTEVAQSVVKVARRVILLISRVSDFVPLVGLRGKIQNINKSMISEHLVERLHQSGSAKNTVVTKDLYQLGQCLQEKIEVGP